MFFVLFFLFCNLYSASQNTLTIKLSNTESIELQEQIYRECDTLAASIEMKKRQGQTTLFEYDATTMPAKLDAPFFFKNLPAIVMRYESSSVKSLWHKKAAQPFLPLLTTVITHAWIQKMNRIQQATYTNETLQALAATADYFGLNAKYLDAFHYFLNNHDRITKKILNFELFNEDTTRAITSELQYVLIEKTHDYDTIRDYGQDSCIRLLSCIEYVGTKTVDQRMLTKLIDRLYQLNPGLIPSHVPSFKSHIKSLEQLIDNKTVTPYYTRDLMLTPLLRVTMPTDTKNEDKIHTFGTLDLFHQTERFVSYFEIIANNQKISHINQEIIDQLKDTYDHAPLHIYIKGNPLTEESLAFLKQNTPTVLSIFSPELIFKSFESIMKIGAILALFYQGYSFTNTSSMIDISLKGIYILYTIILITLGIYQFKKRKEKPAVFAHKRLFIYYQ